RAHEHMNVASFSPDGRAFWVGTQEGELYVARPAEKSYKKVDTTLPGVAGYTWTDDGRRIVAWPGGEDNPVLVWGARSLSRLATFLAEDGVSIVAFSHDGKRLAVGTDCGEVQLLELDGEGPEPPYETVVRLYLPDPWRWDDRLTARCHGCGNYFVPDSIVLEA